MSGIGQPRSSINSSFTQPGMSQSWDGVSGLSDLGLPLSATLFDSQVPHSPLLPEKSRHNFLRSIYVLRNAFRQSSTPSQAEISQLAHETRLDPYEVSMWFDGERTQRDFWTSQNSLPTPQNSRKFADRSFIQDITSNSKSDLAALEVPSTIAQSKDDDLMLGMPFQATAEPQRSKVSAFKHSRKLQQERGSSRISGLTGPPRKRIKKQYRSRRSNEDRDQDTSTFGCPTCPTLSKSIEEWYTHQKRCHFPKQVWVCGSAGQKSCKIPPSKRRDNFRSHLKNAHGFAVGDELDTEVRKRAVQVTGLFHEKCGFCPQALGTWETSMLHIWEHVEGGARMADWNHVCETEHELTANVHYEIPPEHFGPSQDNSDDDGSNDDGLNDGDPNNYDPNSGNSPGDKFDFDTNNDFDNFNLDRDLGGGFYDGGLEQADRGITRSPDFYRHQANSSNSGTNEATNSHRQVQKTEYLTSHYTSCPNSVRKAKLAGRSEPLNVGRDTRQTYSPTAMAGLRPHDRVPDTQPTKFPKFDVNEAFQDFERTLSGFTVKPTYKGGRPYVLAQSLVDWLRSRWAGHMVTQADRLHKAAYYITGGLFEPISAEQLSSEQNGCLLVFSILLVLHKGALIDRFQRRGIVDSQIPMPLERLEMVIRGMELDNADFQNLASCFYEKQWLFCPIIIFRDMDRYYEKEAITPICSKQKINDKGGIAAGVYLIEVQEQFVAPNLKMGAVRYEDKHDSFGQRYQFALKTFHESQRGLFENETQAFKALKGHRGMVQYLGEFTHEGYNVSSTSDVSSKTHNILLEYGDLDLEEYFFERLPPVVPTEILGFWKNLFEVCDALKGIHNLKYGKGELAEEFHGWHADVKPDNILSVHGKFKLADLGFSHFARKTGEIPMGKVLGGTETYGAPECYQNRQNSQTAVHQTIDIWSLGCVFSIAATWVALGYQGILQYAEFRNNAIKKYRKQNPSHVEADAMDKKQSSDQEMSLRDSFHNGYEVLQEVKYWHESLRTILRKTDTVTSQVLRLIDNAMLLSDPIKRHSAEKIWSELQQISMGGGKYQLQLDEKASQMTPKYFRSLNELALGNAPRKTLLETASPDLRGSNRKSKLLEIPLMRATHRSEVFEPRLYQMSLLLVGIDGSQFPEMAHVSENTRSTLLLAPHAQLMEQPFSKVTAIDRNTSKMPFPNAPTSFEYLNRPRVPRQNVFEARQQLDRPQKGIRGIARKILRRPAKDRVLNSHFKDRDLLFLVDNGATMKQYWLQAAFLLETLAMKTCDTNPDGLNLMFTIGQQGLKGETRVSAFMEAMVHPNAMPKESEITDLRKSLGNIFDKYLMSLEEAKRNPRGFSKLKSLAIIVLTDGLWQDDLVKERIGDQVLRFLRRLRDLLDPMTRRVSIQFIQFGKDADATARLKDVAELLKAQGLPDVIDTEPCDGDIHKMLLGGFVRVSNRDENNFELAELSQGLQDSRSVCTPDSMHTSPSHDRPYAPLDAEMSDSDAPNEYMLMVRGRDSGRDWVAEEFRTLFDSGCPHNFIFRSGRTKIGEVAVRPLPPGRDGKLKGYKSPINPDDLIVPKYFIRIMIENARIGVNDSVDLKILELPEGTSTGGVDIILGRNFLKKHDDPRLLEKVAVANSEDPRLAVATDNSICVLLKSKTSKKQKLINRHEDDRRRKQEHATAIELYKKFKEPSSGSPMGAQSTGPAMWSETSGCSQDISAAFQHSASVQRPNSFPPSPYFGGLTARQIAQERSTPLSDYLDEFRSQRSNTSSTQFTENSQLSLDRQSTSSSLESWTSIPPDGGKLAGHTMDYVVPQADSVLQKQREASS